MAEPVKILAIKSVEAIFYLDLFNQGHKPGHNILKLYNMCRSDSAQVKRKVISSVKNLVKELPHRLPSDLRLTTLGNLGKISNLAGDIIWPSSQFFIQKLSIGSSSQNVHNSSYQSFLVLSSFTRAFYFVLYILSVILGFRLKPGIQFMKHVFYFEN